MINASDELKYELTKIRFFLCFAVAILRVLQIAEGLLQQNRRATKRDIYYTDPALLKGQRGWLTPCPF